MARLSTHVLDTSRGLPASGIVIDVYRFDTASNKTQLNSAVTNADGRTESPLLSPLTSGTYELVFHVGSYLRTTQPTLPEPAFLDDVVIRFGISNPESNYHVPLLLSPYGYSTYRGS